ncbi:MAG: ATP-binding protein [Desulfurococcaceae archaeon]
MKRIGIVSSGASTLYAPIQILKQAERDAKEEALVLVKEDSEGEAKLYLGVLRNIRAHDPLLPHNQRSSVIDNPELAKLGNEVVFVNSYVRILGELENNIIKPATRPPTPRSYVYMVESPSDIQLNLGSGLVLGIHKYSGLEIPMPVDSLRYHIGVVGATGTGKSRLVLALIREVLEKTNWKIVVFDHSGLDYVKYFKEHTIDGGEIAIDIDTICSYLVRESGIKDEEYLYVSLLGYILFELGKLPISTKPLEGYFSQQKSKTKGSPENEKITEKIAKATLEIENFDESLVNVKWDLRKFIEITKMVLKELGAKKSTSIKIETKLLLYSKHFFKTLNMRKVTIRDIIEKAIRDRLVIIDLSTLEQSVKRYVVKSVISKLWEIIDTRKEQVNTLLVVDEAHNYACEKCYDSNYEISRTAREGRKWGLGLVLASQRIIDFETEVRNNINTFFFSRLQTPGDLQNLQGVLDLGGISYENLAILSQREFFMAGLGNPLKYPILLKVKEIGD